MPMTKPTSEQVTFLAAGSGASQRTVLSKLQDVVSVRDFGAVGDGVADDGSALQAAINFAGTSGGGIVDGHGLTYLNNNTNLVVNYDNVMLKNIVFKRTSSTTGYMIRFATTANTSGGGICNCRFIGVSTVSGGNAAIGMGTATYKASDYILSGIEVTGWSQYGIGIEAGDNWKISDIWVMDHGLTSGSIASCIGFYVYPKIASSGGQISNVYSEIGAACVANASANTAAVKLQTHSRLLANGIAAVNGSEQCMSIDSVDGIVSQVYVYPQAIDAGLVVGNYNTAHSFSGQTFVLDSFYISNSVSTNNGFLIAGGTNGQYQLTGCTIRNGYGNSGAGYLAYSNCRNCTFENLNFEDLRFDAAARGFAANSLASTRNTFRNIIVRGGTSTGVLYIETSDSVLTACGTNAVAGDTAGTFLITGSTNTIVSPCANNVSGNGITIAGSNNLLNNVCLGVVSGRSVWFQSGSNNNRVISGNLNVGTGYLDNGTGNYAMGLRQWQYGSAAPTTGTWAVGDLVYNTAPASAGYVGWVCTTAGTPGTWKTFGLIS